MPSIRCLAFFLLATALSAAPLLHLGPERKPFTPSATSRPLGPLAAASGLTVWHLAEDFTRDGIPDRLYRVYLTTELEWRGKDNLKGGPEGLLLYQGLPNGGDSLVWASDAALPWLGCACGYLNCDGGLLLGPKGTLYLREGGGSHCTSLYTTTQYRYEKGEFVAIGITTSSSDGGPDGPQITTESDHNLLTGRFIETVVNEESGRRRKKVGRKSLRPRPLLRTLRRHCLEAPARR
ncbi:MAG: hypothetical protein RL318_2249 [Fibrobacterota bacterium]|jgi:hypothetical protein